ncbi:MAG: hypothetical protein KJ002_09820 [Candidatus Dadabacteria bacterium]|nr:hypothetical protein [Candidatus Dadabacteria bacterium]
MNVKHMLTLFAAIAAVFCGYACGGETEPETGENAPAATSIRTQAVDDAPAPVRTASPEAEAAGESIGFLALVPDRGFSGNQETRAAFEGFGNDYNAGLAFVTGEDFEKNVHEALENLEAGNVSTIWVLPFFLSSSDSKYKNGVEALKTYKGNASIAIAENFGQSHLAEEVLSDRASALSANPSGETLVVVGSGATDAESEQAIKADLERIVAGANAGLGFGNTAVVVLYSWEADDALKGAATANLHETIAESTKDGGRAVVVPFNLAMKLTGMMSEWSMVQGGLAKYPGAVYDGKDVTPHEYVTLWFRKKANERLPLEDDEVGVVYMPHGSDYNWNHSMSTAIDELRDKYMFEDAFSMSEIDVVEPAVRRLEERGAKGIVVLRVFSLESSFKKGTERMLGLTGDEAAGYSHKAAGHGSGHGGAHGGGHGGEHGGQHDGGHVSAHDGGHGDTQAAGAHGGHGDHGGHGHGHGGSSRIASDAVFVTLGGIEAHPLLSEAMADRAKELSTDPSKETVILLSHGTESDHANDYWMNNLKTIAEYIQSSSPVKYRDVKYYTWREDWPDKREKSIEVIRGMVEEAAADGGTAIVIPVRTTGEGHERKYLDGLEYKLGSGFAPHPNYVKWVEEKIEEGIAELRQDIEKRNEQAEAGIGR